MTSFVFLHGGVQGGWVWSETLAALRQQDPSAQALALDVPGCGAKRGRDTAAIAFDDIVNELVADIRAAGVEGAVLVGHSQAGTVLPRMVEQAPGLFRKLVYVACVAPKPGETVLVGTVGEAPPREPDEIEAVVRRQFCNDMTPAQADAFMAKLGRDGWPPIAYAETDWRYDHLAGHPSAYVFCLQDAAVSPERQTQAAERLKVERIVRIDCGHQAMVTRPQGLAEILRLEGARLT